METTSILKKHVSLCPNIKAKSYCTITLFDALNAIRTKVYASKIDAIRNLYAQDNYDAYRSKKKQLPAYLFSGTLFDSRHKDDVSGYTSLLIIDIDHLDDTEAVKSILKSDPHIVSIWLSPSGQGLKLLFCVDYNREVDHEDLWVVHEHCAFPQVAEYLFAHYDINVDKTGGDITRLCFVSSDPDIHLKREFQPFPVSVTLNKNQIKHIQAVYRNRSINGMQRVPKLNILSKITLPNVELKKLVSTDSHEIYYTISRIHISIITLDFDTTDFLVLSLREYMESLSNIQPQESSFERYYKHLDEVDRFTQYLKCLQKELAEKPDIIPSCEFNLPQKFRKCTVNNLRSKVRFTQLINIIKEGGIDPACENFIQIKTELENLVLRGFSGGGCSVLRKWAK